MVQRGDPFLGRLVVFSALKSGLFSPFRKFEFRFMSYDGTHTLIIRHEEMIVVPYIVFLYITK